MEKICVAVRLRPPVSQEISNGAYWKVEDNRISLHKPLGTPISGVSYTFDHVFDQSCRNARVYELLTKGIIRAAVEGFNGTAFAYGQTSSGKTFTMNGSDNDPGIIQLAVKDIFQNIQMMPNREFLIRVSYMEIYNEEINDLFVPENQKLQIHESLERGIFVAGLREEIVNSSEQVIESKEKDISLSEFLNSDAIRVSVLNLVDLAGSERIAKTGADGVRLKEGKHINKSLMVLGNVINKLSDGGKQRGHIPYRDSKLTRILQPALGGNAKTSIICTVAPEEVHIEETRGTLQFATRAKRITNCVQVNEILTDTALLKRQKLEIEELRKKLQGSHSEVLEQEILKLRNDMLKYELEHEKLATELAEERRSHQERERCIREQQMKIDNLSSLFTSSDHDINSGQNSSDHPFPQNFGQDSWEEGLESVTRSLKEESNGSHSICQSDAFRTPCFKAARNAFVVKRSDYSMLPDSSPIPDDLSNVADEDMWLKLNKGYTADLDSLQITPARKAHSLPSMDVSPDFSIDYYKEEVHNLRRQLEQAIEEKEEDERNYAKQILLNSQIMEEISKLQQESRLIQETPQRLRESVAICKDVYKDILLVVQSFVFDGKSPTTKFLSCATEIGLNLFSTLEAHFSMDTDSHKIITGEGSTIREQCKLIFEGLNSIIPTLVSSQASAEDTHPRTPLCGWENKGSTFGGAIAGWKEKLGNELNEIKEKYQGLERELNHSNQLLEASKQRYHSLEREFVLLKEERVSLVQKISKSSQEVEVVNNQKEKIVSDLNIKAQRRKDLEEAIKQFNLIFASRQRSFLSFHGDVVSKVNNLTSHSPDATPKTFGC